MKTVSFTFELYDQFFPEDKTGKEFTYARWPTTLSIKKWGADLSLLEQGLVSIIVQHTGINRASQVQAWGISGAIHGQVKGERVARHLKKLEQNGIISNLLFDSKQVSKKASIDSSPLAYSSNNTKQEKNNNKGKTEDHDAVLGVLNELTDGHYKKSTELLERLKTHTKEECIAVVRNRFAKWDDDPKMRQFLRPSTLFRKSKFEEDYLPQAQAAITEDEKMRKMFGEPNG